MSPKKEEPTMTEQKNNIKLLSTKTGILDQARLRPHDTSLGPSFEGKITSTLIRLKVSGLALSVIEHFSYRLSFSRE